MSDVKVEQYVCTACGLTNIPRTENFQSGWPSTVSIHEGVMYVVPHTPGCWRFASAITNAKEIDLRLQVAVTPGGVRYVEDEE